jgi:hypothetical protein
MTTIPESTAQLWGLIFYLCHPDMIEGFEEADPEAAELLADPE